MNDESMQDEDFTNVYQTVMLSRRLNQSSNSSIVQLDFLDRPSDLLMNCSNHFADAESFRLERSIREVETPMDCALQISFFDMC